jgi:hypothetical protein
LEQSSQPGCCACCPIVSQQAERSVSASPIGPVIPRQKLTISPGVAAD